MLRLNQRLLTASSATYGRHNSTIPTSTRTQMMTATVMNSADNYNNYSNDATNSDYDDNEVEDEYGLPNDKKVTMTGSSL